MFKRSEIVKGTMAQFFFILVESVAGLPVVEFHTGSFFGTIGEARRRHPVYRSTFHP